MITKHVPDGVGRGRLSGKCRTVKLDPMRINNSHRGGIVLVSLALLLALGGCPADPDSGGSTSNGGSNGAGQPGQSVDPAARTAVINAVGATLNGLSTDDITGNQTAVVNMLKARSEIQAAGTNSDGSVWAVFTDGRPLVVALNQAISQDLANAKVAAAAGAPKPLLPGGMAGPLSARKTGRNRDSGPYGLPTSNQAIVLNGFGLEGDTQAHVNAVAAWLTRRGYTDVAPDHLATVENYRKVQNVGVLYVNGHGGVGYLPVVLGTSVTYEPVFALGTLTARADDGSTDAQYEALLDSQQLGYLVIPTYLFGIQLNYGPVAASRYFITKAFAAEQWDFAPASWVYLDVCDSFDQVFKDTCFENGAGLFMGWDLTVRHSDSIESSRYLLTRCLGISDASGAAVNPPQRAWDFNAVFSRMQTTSRSVPSQLPGVPPDILTESLSLHNTNSGGRAELKFELHASPFEPLLQPGIRAISVDDPNGAITILGSFGFEPGAITVGGSAVTIDQWGTSTVYGHVSPDAHGPVIVSIGGHDSDPRQLTQWHGTASAVYSGLNLPTEKVNVEFTFRGDLQSSRLFPDDPPKYYNSPSFRCIPQRSSLLLADTSGTIPCSNNSPDSATISTPGPLANAMYIDVGDFADGFWFQRGQLDTDTGLNQGTGDLRVTVSFGARQANGVLTVSHCNGGNNQFRSPLEIGSGIQVEFTVGNYDFFDSNAATDNGVTLTTTIDMFASGMPSDSDPR